MFLENRGEAFGVWREPFVELRVPLLFNLRRDPGERAQHNSNTYNDWFISRVSLSMAAISSGLGGPMSFSLVFTSIMNRIWVSV